VLVLKKPSLVIVYPLAEKSTSVKEQEELADADADFYYYASKIQKAMANSKTIAIVNSKANLFRFANKTQKSLSRKQLEGLGFIFYKPNSKPLVFKGVATDEDVVCQATIYFQIKVDGYECAL
jgi:hypothetical protein